MRWSAMITPADTTSPLPKNLSPALLPSFGDRNGQLRASTGRSSQQDVWGSAFAVATAALPIQSSPHRLSPRHFWRRFGPVQFHGKETPDMSRPTVTSMSQRRGNALWVTGLSTDTRMEPTGGHRQVGSAGRVLRLMNRMPSSWLQNTSRSSRREISGRGIPLDRHLNGLHPSDDYRRNPLSLASMTVPLTEFIRLGWVQSGVCSG